MIDEDIIKNDSSIQPSSQTNGDVVADPVNKFSNPNLDKFVEDSPNIIKDMSFRNANGIVSWLETYAKVLGDSKSEVNKDEIINNISSVFSNVGETLSRANPKVLARRGELPGFVDQEMKKIENAIRLNFGELMATDVEGNDTADKLKNLLPKV